MGIHFGRVADSTRNRGVDKTPLQCYIKTMKTIDVTGPEGNVFCILGFARSFQRQLKQAGGNNDTLDEVLKNFTQLDYDTICEKLESTGLFEFTFGDDDDDDDEDEDWCPDCGEDWGYCRCR